MKFIKKNLSLILSLSAMIVGVGLGFIFLTTNEGVKAQTINVINPIQNVFINIICYLAVPLLFICVVTSIYNMGNLKTFGKTGARVVIQYILMMFLLAFIAGLVSSLCFNLKIGTQKTDLSESLSLLKNFIPTNLWDPFIYRNILQVNLLAIIAGVTLLIIGKDALWVINGLTKINKFIIKVFSYIGKLVPLYILISMIKIVLLQDSHTLSNIWKLILVFVLMNALLVLIYLIRTLIVSKGKEKKALIKALPPFIIAISSANSTLALDSNLKVSQESFSEKESYTKFSIPLAMMLFKPSGVMYLAVVAPYFAMINGIEISLTWLFALAIISTILNIAIPPVNGGGINNYSILLKELALPLTPLPILIVLDSIMEFIITGFNVYGQTLETYLIAKTSHNIK